MYLLSGGSLPMNAPFPKSSSYGNTEMAIYFDIINLIGRLRALLGAKTHIGLIFKKILMKFGESLLGIMGKKMNIGILKNERLAQIGITFFYVLTSCWGNKGWGNFVMPSKCSMKICTSLYDINTNAPQKCLIPFIIYIDTYSWFSYLKGI